MGKRKNNMFCFNLLNHNTTDTLKKCVRNKLTLQGVYNLRKYFMGLIALHIMPDRKRIVYNTRTLPTV